MTMQVKTQANPSFKEDELPDAPVFKPWTKNKLSSNLMLVYMVSFNKLEGTYEKS